MTGSSEKRKKITSMCQSWFDSVSADFSRFHDFFHHVDHYRSEYFLWVTASGLSAAKQSQMRKGEASDDEADANGEEG